MNENLKEDKVIQTIVMRSKYPGVNGDLRKLRAGKYCAQSSHACMAFLLAKHLNQKNPQPLTKEETEWINTGTTKICLYVETEEDLLRVFNDAKKAGLTVHLIKDAGHTEFDGVPTHTCLAIGPHYKSKIDAVTGDLSLF